MKILIITLLGIFTTCLAPVYAQKPVTGKCGWLNLMDNTLPSDPGRGITNWDTHYNHAKTTADLNGTTAVFIGNRLRTLSGCLDLNTYATLYANISVKIANYGVSFAKWTNDLNNTVLGSGDVGCGYKDWNAHFNHVENNGYAPVPGLIEKRMSLLLKTISLENYAKLYADVSVEIATFATTNRLVPVAAGK